MRTLCALLMAAGSLFVASSGIAATSAGEYRELGLLYRSQERYPEAIAAFKKSVELEPKNPSGRVLLGWTQHLAHQEEAAAASLLQVVSLTPGHVPALNALGIVYLVKGELGWAVVTHTWAAILKPDNEIAYYNLSLAYQRLQLHHWAIANATQAAALEPTNPHPLVALALAHWSRDERSTATQVYQQAIGLDSRYRDRAFLSHLQEAGFSPTQIQAVEEILAVTN